MRRWSSEVQQGWSSGLQRPGHPAPALRASTQEPPSSRFSACFARSACGWCAPSPRAGGPPWTDYSPSRRHVHGVWPMADVVADGRCCRQR
eukprot:5980170-Prymnesium_polylepis.1